MNNIVAWGNQNKTILTGVVLIITGAVQMLTSGGDSVAINSGWTQVLAGMTAIFLQNKLQTVQNTAENVVPTRQIEALMSGYAVDVKAGSETIQVAKVDDAK